MLITAKALNGYTLDSLDGEIGKVKEFYFDDQHWAIRYLVAETGTWLTGRQVLISPYALISANKQEQHIGINLTKKQIEDSPSLDSDKPVSRQFEESYYGFYGYPMYWGVTPSMDGANAERGIIPAFGVTAKKEANPHHGEQVWDPHLRSTHDMIGHHIQSTDADIGHVEDFIIDDTTWKIRYLIINTRNWWPGKKVLVSPQWIERISWETSDVFVNLPSETIKQSPEYTEEALLTRDYETGLHRHYDRPGYWAVKPDTK